MSPYLLWHATILPWRGLIQVEKQEESNEFQVRNRCIGELVLREKQMAS